MNNEIATIIILIIISINSLGQIFLRADSRQTIITAIQDNGCSKQAQIELSQTKSNADMYNYAALSTSY